MKSTLSKVTKVEQGSMSREQYNYAVALVVRDIAIEKFEQMVSHLQTPANPYEDGPARDAWLECRCQEAYDAVVETENQMIEWARKESLRIFGPARFAKIEQTFNLALVIAQGKKQELVEICFKMPGGIEARPRRRAS